MKSIESYLEQFHHWLIELSKKEKLLSTSYSEDKTCALGTTITQKTKAITFYEKGKSHFKCLSKSPFLTLRKEVIFDGRDEVIIKQNKKEQNLTLEEYKNRFGNLPLNKIISDKEDFKQFLFPFLIDKTTIKSVDQKKEGISFLLDSNKATARYQKEVKENGGFDELPSFSACEFTFNTQENKATIESSYKGKNGFFNLKMEEKTTIFFQENLLMSEDIFSSLDIDAIPDLK